jgi:hypothetical protein
LGESEGSIAGDRMRMRASHSVVRESQYAVHDLKMESSSRVRQYVSSNGRIFAVSWHTLYKPDLSEILGSSFSSYASSAHEAAKRGGIQRQFRHVEADLVVQSAGHLNVYQGFAYRPSLMPRDISPQSLGLR